MTKTLRELRDERGLTQEDMAKALGVSKATYCGYETGAHALTLRDAQIIAKRLQLRVDDILFPVQRVHAARTSRRASDEIEAGHDEQAAARSA